MKKGLSLIVLSIFVTLYSCDTTSSTDETPVQEAIGATEVPGMYLFTEFNEEYSLPIDMLVLDKKSAAGLSIPPIVEAYPDDFRWEVVIGDGFHVVIEDIGNIKNEIADLKSVQADDAVWEVDYLIDEPELIMYTQKLPNNAGVKDVFYHLYAFKTINGVNYVFKTPDQGEFSKYQIEKMLAAIRSAKYSEVPAA